MSSHEIAVLIYKSSRKHDSGHAGSQINTRHSHLTPLTECSMTSEPERPLPVIVANPTHVSCAVRELVSRSLVSRGSRSSTLERG